MIPVSEPLITDEDVKFVSSVLKDGWVSGEGPVVAEFEARFAAHVGTEHAVAVSSGTAAIDCLISALDIRAGDEVVMPAFTIISCALQVVRQGATPVLVDSDPDDWNMRVEKVESVITDRTKAVMAVHTYGLPVDMQVLEELRHRYGFTLLEDAAEAHGLRIGAKYCGSIGDAGVFSFYSNKTLTTGEGGMVVTDSADTAERVRLLRNLGFRREARFVHDELAWNYRMSSMQAALGISQLSRLDSSVEKKQQIGQWYRERLVGIPDISFAPPRANNGLNTYWIFGFVLGDRWPNADRVRAKLAERGVGTRPFFCPLHLQPGFRSGGLFASASFPVAERLWAKGLYLPSGLTLTEDDVDFVCQQVKEVLR